MKRQPRSLKLGIGAVVAAVLCASVSLASAHGGKTHAFLNHFTTVTSVASTVPANGDVNPYGIARVPRSKGELTRGDFLISNFNNWKNLQGTGTTIMEISPHGFVKQFAAIDAGKLPGPCPGGVGLTTALVALRGGYVIVGSLPTSDGTSATAQAGCLIVLDSNGNVVETLHGSLINGPWDMTAVDDGSAVTLFVTNVLNGTVAANGSTVDMGTVLRIRLRIHHHGIPAATAMDVIGTGFSEHTDPNALVVGPTGVALKGGHGHGDKLYVADTVNNRIAVIPNAFSRKKPLGHGGNTVSMGGELNQPLGLALAPDHEIIAANAADGNFVDVTPAGKQVAAPTVDSAGGGVLFGLAIPNRNGVWFVDDGDNTLRFFH